MYGEGLLPLPLPPLVMPRDEEPCPREGLPAGLTAEPLSEENPRQKNFLPETKGSAAATAGFGGPPRVPFLRPRTAFASVLKKLNRPWSVRWTPSFPKIGLRASNFSDALGGIVPTQPSVSVTQNLPSPSSPTREVFRIFLKCKIDSKKDDLKPSSPKLVE